MKLEWTIWYGSDALKDCYDRVTCGGEKMKTESIAQAYTVYTMYNVHVHVHVFGCPALRTGNSG